MGSLGGAGEGGFRGLGSFGGALTQESDVAKKPLSLDPWADLHMADRSQSGVIWDCCRFG